MSWQARTCVDEGRPTRRDVEQEAEVSMRAKSLWGTERLSDRSCSREQRTPHRRFGDASECCKTAQRGELPIDGHRGRRGGHDTVELYNAIVTSASGRPLVAIEVWELA